MELLWTDTCFLFLLSVSLILVGVSLRKPLVRGAFVRLWHQPFAVCSGIVLGFFLIIGVLDSLHMPINTDKTRREGAPVNGLVSVLDKLLAPLDEVYENTYSAPMALKSFSTETIMVDGVLKQIYPPLYYTRGITSHRKKMAVIRPIMIKSLAAAVLVPCGLGLLLFLGFRKKSSTRPLFHKGVWCGLVTVGVCVFVLMAGYWLSRYYHVLGTGKIGQDIFYYTIKSIRTALVIGTLTTLFMLPLAIVSGILAGYYGGMVDDIIQYLYTTLSSIPGVLLITASVLSMQTWIANHPHYFTTLTESADARLFALCLILGVTSWTSLCRLLRAETLKLREMDFVLAAKALGSSSFYIFHKHLLPNVMPIILITLVLDFSFLVLAEAVLSYVGVGVSPMTISWGNMINGARLELAREPVVWWPMFAAFTLMFTLVLASNLFADAVREVFDPRQIKS